MSGGNAQNFSGELSNHIHEKVTRPVTFEDKRSVHRLASALRVALRGKFAGQRGKKSNQRKKRNRKKEAFEVLAKGLSLKKSVVTERSQLKVDLNGRFGGEARAMEVLTCGQVGFS